MLVAKTENGMDYLLLENGNKIPVEARAVSEKWDALKVNHSLSSSDKELAAKKIFSDTLISLPDLAKADPERALLIQQQIKGSNDFSNADQDVSPETVKVHITFLSSQSKPAMSSLRDDQQKMQHILHLTSADYERAGQDPQILGIIRHEAGHALYARSNSDFQEKLENQSVSKEEQRVNELQADRYAGPSAAEFLLSAMASDAKHTLAGFSFYHNAQMLYDYDHTQSDHPNTRTRMEALLHQAYGNDIFRSSGAFNGDGVFEPKRDAGVTPITEDGRKVLNWDDEIAPAIEEQVESDVSRLDELISSGVGFTEDDVKQFMQEVTENAQKFKQENVPEFEATTVPETQTSTSQSLSASNKSDYQMLANQFRQLNCNPDATQYLASLHPNMQNAQLASNAATEQIRYSLLNESAQNTAIGHVNENIALGIERGQFPSPAMIAQEGSQTQLSNERSQSREMSLPGLG